MDQLCETFRRNHMQLGMLFKQYPGIIRDLPYLEDKLPIRWKLDPPGLILRKLGRDLLAVPLVRGGLRLACKSAERYWPSSKMLTFLVGSC